MRFNPFWLESSLSVRSSGARSKSEREQGNVFLNARVSLSHCVCAVWREFCLFDHAWEISIFTHVSTSLYTRGVLCCKMSNPLPTTMRLLPARDAPFLCVKARLHIYATFVGVVHFSLVPADWSAVCNLFLLIKLPFSSLVCCCIQRYNLRHLYGTHI